MLLSLMGYPKLLLRKKGNSTQCFQTRELNGCRRLRSFNTIKEGYQSASPIEEIDSQKGGSGRGSHLYYEGIRRGFEGIEGKFISGVRYKKRSV